MIFVKKIDVKKCLLYISLLPYLYVIIMCIYHAIFGYDYGLEAFEPNYGIDGMMEFLHNFWFDNILMFNYIGAIVILSVCYQIYYFVSYKKNKEVKESKYMKINLKKILFVISLLCWVIYFVIGLSAFFFGASAGLFDSEVVYGFEAVKSTLFWFLLVFSIIPVLPITLIYIIVYLIVKYKEKMKSKSKVNKEE